MTEKSAFCRLLDQKIQEAVKENAKRMEQFLLYGFPPKSELKGIGGMGELKDIISAAYDQHMPVDKTASYIHTYGNLSISGRRLAKIDGVLGSATNNHKSQITDSTWGGQPFKDLYLAKITDTIISETPLLTHLKKGNEMTVVKDLRAEINHEKEEKRVTKALKKFEGSWLYKLKEGAHIGFDVTFEEGGTAYAYAAISDGDRWHLTGARSPQKISTDDLVDWLIERNVKFKEVKLYKAVSK